MFFFLWLALAAWALSVMIMPLWAGTPCKRYLHTPYDHLLMWFQYLTLYMKSCSWLDLPDRKLLRTETVTTYRHLVCLYLAHSFQHNYYAMKLSCIWRNKGMLWAINIHLAISQISLKIGRIYSLKHWLYLFQFSATTNPWSVPGVHIGTGGHNTVRLIYLSPTSITPAIFPHSSQKLTFVFLLVPVGM